MLLYSYNYLYIALNRQTKYSNTYPYNVGYYDGTYICWDCWHLGETIIATRGAAVYNYTAKTKASAWMDNSIGLSGQSGNWLKSACSDTLSSDFSNIVPGEWLFRDRNGSCYHVGYYVGNGQVIEITSDGTANVQLTTIDEQGHSNLRGKSWTWTYHAKVPWITYCSHTSDYWNNTGYCTQCGSWLPNKSDNYGYNPDGSVFVPGYYDVKPGCTAYFYPGHPYESVENPLTLTKTPYGQGLPFERCVQNGFGQVFYVIVNDESGEMYYCPANQLVYVSAIDSTLSIDPAKTSYTIQQGSSCSVTGSITSNYNITKVTATLDGSQYVNLTPNTKSVNIGATGSGQINSFKGANLSVGTHYIVITATDSSPKTVTKTITIKVDGEPEYETCTIVYNDNGGTGGPGTQTFIYSGGESISTVVPTREGYTFECWIDDYTGYYYYPDDSIPFLWEDRSLTAQWRINRYYLEFNFFLDGVYTPDFLSYGYVELYINGDSHGQIYGDWWQQFPYGTQYEFRPAYTAPGYSYSGVRTGSICGTIGTSDVKVQLDYSTNYYTFDINGYLDGSYSGTLSGYGTVDVYIDGALVAQNADDYCVSLPYGTSYEIKNICSTTGHQYVGVNYGSLSGYMGENNVNIYLSFTTCQYYLNLNGFLDGSETGSIRRYGTADVYINGNLVANDCVEYYAAWPCGTTYEIKDIRPADGSSYDGISSISVDGYTAGARTGTLTRNTNVRLVFHTSPSSLSETPEPVIFNNHTYYYFSTPVTWYDAKKICENMGGHLATISSAEEDSFIFNLSQGTFAWLGASDIENEGCWKWITGEDFSYCNWYPENPDNSPYNPEGAENYLHFSGYGTGEWNDNAGCNLFPFVCEVDSVCYLNLNGLLDGSEAGSIRRYGTADVYINGNLVANDCVEYYAAWPYGTTYEIKDIRPADGSSYDGISSISVEGYTAGARAGTLAGNTNVRLILHTSPTSLDETPEPAVFNNHTYYYFSTPVTWYDAKVLCENMGGHLVTVTSEEETSFLVNLVGQRSGEEYGCYIWLGATDKDSEGTWRWVTGEEMTYTKWFTDEPDNYPQDTEGAENYAQFYTWQGHWNDCYGCYKMPFVCEVDSANYTILFDPNGGNGTMDDVSATFGVPVTLPECGFTKDDSVFLGWNLRRESDQTWYVWGRSFVSSDTIETEGLVKKLYVPGESVFIGFGDYGNTESYSYVAVWLDLLTPDCALPSSLLTIDDEAFFGCAFRYVRLPDGAESIGRYAFAESDLLEYIYIPESVTDIDPTAFDKVEGLTILGVPGSTAADFAKQYGFSFIEG